MTPAKPKMLFVDDRSKRIHAALKQHGEKYEVTIAPNVPEALRLISKGEWDVISLDYDLDGNDFNDPESETCGMEIVRYLVEWPEDKLFPWITLHSTNIFGAERMYRGLLQRFPSGLGIEKLPFVYEGEA